MSPPSVNAASPAAQALYSEMIRELLARRRVLISTKNDLMSLSGTLNELDARLAVIDEELLAYGYVNADGSVIPPLASAPHGRSAPTVMDLAPDPNTGG